MLLTIEHHYNNVEKLEETKTLQRKENMLVWLKHFSKYISWIWGWFIKNLKWSFWVTNCNMVFFKVHKKHTCDFNYLTSKFGDLFLGKVLWFNYDLIMVFDFHVVIYVKSHVKSFATLCSRSHRESLGVMWCVHFF